MLPKDITSDVTCWV